MQEDIDDSDSENGLTDGLGDSDVQVLPTMEPQTPILNNHPYPYFAFTPSIIPFGTLIGTPINSFQELQYSQCHAPTSPTTPTAPSTPSLSTLPSPDDQVHTSKRPWRTHKSKLNEVFKLLQDFNWTLGDFLYFTFRDKDEHGRKIKDRSEAHTQMASKFLGGFCKHASVDIVEIWVKSPWGIPKKGRWEWNGMFSMDHDF